MHTLNTFIPLYSLQIFGRDRTGFAIRILSLRAYFSFELWLLFEVTCVAFKWPNQSSVCVCTVHNACGYIKNVLNVLNLKQILNSVSIRYGIELVNNKSALYPKHLFQVESEEIS